MKDWIGRKVALLEAGTERAFEGTLHEVSNFGVVIKDEIRNEGKEEFKGLSASADLLIFVPWIRIRSMSTASYKGISDTTTA